MRSSEPYVRPCAPPLDRLALVEADRRGATVSGLDASRSLLEIARARVPGGDIREGDMFALPYDDDGFDVVTSFNGIWGAAKRRCTR